jgi:hypothetical protein
MLSIVPDPRMNRTKKHKLIDILILAIAAVICGCEGWNEIEDFCSANKKFFKRFLELPHGIPSHDTFARVFSIIDEKSIVLNHGRTSARKDTLPPPNPKPQFQPFELPTQPTYSEKKISFHHQDADPGFQPCLDQSTQVAIEVATQDRKLGSLSSTRKDVFPSEHRQQKGFTEWISSTNLMQTKDRDLKNLTSKPLILRTDPEDPPLDFFSDFGWMVFAFFACLCIRWINRRSKLE